MMSKVMICPASYESMHEAVEQAFEIFPLNIKGRHVLIKPNVLRAATPEEGITTHPALLRAVVEKVETYMPASIVVGDNPGVLGYGANEASFEKAGLIAAAKGYYRNIGNDSVPMPFNPEYMSTVSLSKAALDANILISLPKFKTHGLTVISGAIKNSYGLLPGALKAKLHKEAGSPFRFHNMLVDVFKLRIPDLFIVDGVVGMEGNGPVSPDLRDIGRVLASDNAVALDAVIAAMMGCDPGRLPFLRKAKELGLGDFALDTIDVIGELERIPHFKLPLLSGEESHNNEHIQALLQHRIQQRPRVDEALCTGCATCVEQCPASALSITNIFPEVDVEKCIACFCCQEICPEKAIALQ